MPATWIALGVVYVVWGSTYLAIRVMVETIPPLLGTGVRFLLAGALMYAFLLLRGGKARVRVTRSELGGPAVIAALILVGGIGLLTIAEQVVPSSIAALLIASIPLWVILLRAALRDDVSARAVGAVVVGFAGIALLVLPGTRPEGVEAWGIALILLCAVLSAVGTVVSPRLRHPGDPLVATSVQMLIGGAAMVVLGMATGELTDLRDADLSARSLTAFAYLVVLGSVVAYTAFVWLLANAPPSTTSTYAYVNPIVAIVLGALILSEPVTPMVAVAAAVTLTSVALVIRAEAARRAARAAPAEPAAPTGP